MALKITLTPEQFMYFTMLLTAAVEEIMDKVSQMSHDKVMKEISEETIRRANIMQKIEEH